MSSASGPLARHTRIAVVAALGGAAVLAWVALDRMAETMWGMPMGGLHPWSPLDFALMLAMWVVMMIGMMVPSAIPAVMIYARIAGKASRDGHPIAPTAVFVLGYVIAWTLFSVAATCAQWALERAALLSPMWVTTSPLLGASILIAAGLYQLTPWKNACLRHCRAPAEFLAARFSRGALRLGLEHGFTCVGCCAALMLLLFVGGVMNLVWIAAITLFVLVEKVLPLGKLSRVGAALALIISGSLALLEALASRPIAP